MNRHQALKRLSIWLFATGALFMGGAAVIMYRVPTHDALVCSRADGRCLVTHRTGFRSRSGVIPLGTVTGAELRSASPESPRMELWLTATSGEYWVSDFVNWQRPVAEAQLAEILAFVRTPGSPRLESRHDFFGGPVSALVLLILGLVAVIAGLRVRIRAPEPAA